MRRYLSLVLLAVGLSGLPAAPALAQSTSSEPTPFECCSNATVAQIVRQYVRLVDAVIEEPDTRITAFAHALVPYLRTHGALTAEENAVISDLNRIVSEAKNSADDVRAVLPEIGRGVIFLALRHEGGSETVVEAWCPGQGAWLQRQTDKPRSPLGARCGRWR